jgi:hypothetical protein
MGDPMRNDQGFLLVGRSPQILHAFAVCAGEVLVPSGPSADMYIKHCSKLLMDAVATAIEEDADADC